MGSVEVAARLADTLRVSSASTQNSNFICTSDGADNSSFHAGGSIFAGGLKIDKAFVLPPEHRPHQYPQQHALDNPADSLQDHIPVIDLAPLTSTRGSHDAIITKHERDRIVAQVEKACQDWGFFQVTNHGIPVDVIRTLKEAAAAFFALPLEEKRKVKRTQDNSLGYNDEELTKNVRDWKEVFDLAIRGLLELPREFDGDPSITHIVYNQWPPALPSLREACEQYAKEAKKLALIVLGLIAESLGLEKERFEGYFEEGGTSFLRLNHYPVCPAPELALGVSRHKDVGALTVLLQDRVGGLQVRRKHDGKWIDVKPDPLAPVINVGDMIQVFSNDKYQSVEHRVVVNQNTDRYSFPLFFNPIHSVEVSPLHELTSEQNPPRYKPIHWGKYIKSRKDSNYKNLGVENLQIAHYAINT